MTAPRTPRGRGVKLSLGALAGALLLSLAAPSARQGPDQPPRLRSGVDVVRVEASVLDRNRRPVRGLTADDFVVLENGRERPVAAFAAVDLPAAPPVEEKAADWVDNAPRDVASNDGTDAGRLIVIVFDWSIRSYDQQLARRIALTAVDRLGPSDEATVIFTNPAGTAGRTQGFTADRARLRAAINQPFAVALTSPDPTRNKQILDPERYTSGDCLCGLCTLDTLTQLGQTLRTVSQRPKVVLFIGTYVRSFEAMKPSLPVEIPGRITPAWSNMPGMECPARLRDARRSFERSMGEANVTVHVFDPVGLDTEPSTPLGPGRMRERLDTLPVIADITGGRTVANTDAPEAQVASVLDESSAYYVIGFTPAPAGKGDATRRIEVRVRSRDLTVRARNQYNPSEMPHAVAAKEALTRAISDVLPARDLPLELSAVPILSGAQPAALIVGRVAAGTARPSALLAAALTPRAAPVVSRRVSIPPATANSPGSLPLGLLSALPLEPGSYEIRVAAEASGGAAGSVHTFVDIPDFKRAPLSLSGVLLHVAPEEPSAPRDDIEKGLPLVPTARRTFTRSDKVSVFLQVSQGTSRKDAIQPVAVRLRISDVHDAVRRSETGSLAPAQFANHRTANVRLPLAAGELPPGQYLLTFEASAGDLRAERLVRFEIR